MLVLQLYEMDAHVGVEVLGLTYMKGNRPHCGFPEASYHQNAETLARAGYKVLVVEQVHYCIQWGEYTDKASCIC